jgi:hypothetical protein
LKQRLWTLAAAVLGFGLIVGGAASAANPCKKDCAQVKKDCISAAKTAKTACISGGGDKAACKATFKTEKKACLDAFKAAKTTCKTDKENTNVCSPSGAFLD